MNKLNALTGRSNIDMKLQRVRKWCKPDSGFNTKNTLEQSTESQASRLDRF